MSLYTKMFGTYSQRQIKKLKALADEIDALGEKYRVMGDAELRAVTPALKERLSKGETLDDILPDAFAAVREAADRVLGKLCGCNSLEIGEKGLHNVNRRHNNDNACELVDVTPILKHGCRFVYIVNNDTYDSEAFGLCKGDTSHVDSALCKNFSHLKHFVVITQNLIDFLLNNNFFIVFCVN